MLCECCEENKAMFKVNLTNLDGELLDVITLCVECAKGNWRFDKGYVSNEPNFGS